VGWQEQAEYRAMIDEVLEFLSGRTLDVRAKVRQAMLEASEREDYERARNLRDTLKWLEQIEQPAAIEVLGTGDADVIGFARDGDDAVGVVLRVREGRVVGREHAFLENVEEESDEAVLSVFLVRTYVPLPARSTKLMLPFAPADAESLKALLPKLTGNSRSGAWGAGLVDLAEQNARHLMESLRIESFETEERAEDPVYALGRDLGLGTVPRSMICIDISTNQGRDTVGSLIWFEAWPPKKSEYRKFKIKGLRSRMISPRLPKSSLGF
jgi:excinuclease ABC subunit C